MSFPWQSGRQDSNLRPPGPKPGALPSWATSRSEGLVCLRWVGPLSCFAHEHDNGSSLMSLSKWRYCTTSARDARGYMNVVRTLTNKVLGMKSHTNIFCDSELESHKFRGWPRPKFRCYSQTAVVYRLPSTATSIRTYWLLQANRGQSPLQIFSAVTLLADRLGQCAIGDKPLRDGEYFGHLPYFTFTGTVHVVTMPAIAGTGFEPVASRLWA